MANNIFVSYDLNVPGQNYDAVIAKIQSLGPWAHIQQSFWYVNSNLTCEQAFDQIWAEMDARDSLIVLDLTNNNAKWEGVHEDVTRQLQEQWYR